MRVFSPLASKVLDAPCADVLRSLADETRLGVMRLLLDGPQAAGALCAALGIDPTLLSHHLRVLRERGLIERERQGRRLLYRVAPAVLRKRRGNLLDFGCCSIKFEAR